MIRWVTNDGLAEAIGAELQGLDYEVIYFLPQAPVPADAGAILCFGPYDRWMQVMSQVAALKARSDVRFLHWNTENPPDLRLPWKVQAPLAAVRAAVDRLNDSPDPTKKTLVNFIPLSLVNRRMHKFRYLGEYLYTQAQGWVDVLASSSKVYTDIFNQHRLPTSYIPWGTSPQWYSTLDLPRDIDVLWFGKRRTKRRKRLLQGIQRDLCVKNLCMYIADNVEHPFIYQAERTHFLNRSKITLNLLPTWYDNAFPYRFHVAAGNRSLVISETILPHCPEIQPGVHYVSVPAEKLVEAIQYYLNHPAEREQIANNAYRLVTEQMTLKNSVRKLMASLTAA